MSISSISSINRYILWGIAAGRCQYEGCNEKLYQDPTTKAEFNQAYIAHIIADKPGGPRGHETLSEELGDDISNLMLLCDRHHRLVDIHDVDGHPITRLREMKRKHEDRINTVSGINKEMKSHIVLFGARIGEHGTPLTYKEAANSMVPDYYPATEKPIELSMVSPHKDEEDRYWEIQSESLRRNFEIELSRLKETTDIPHFSIFGLAPQPLLIQLGVLFSEISKAKVYTRLREPETWKHPEDDVPIDFEVIKPANTDGDPVLNISITAEIEESRIEKVMGEEISIWKLTVPKPGKDLIRSDRALENFRGRVREVFEEVKKAHGQDSLIHVFPAMPNSTAIEFGRVWQPKAELPMKIYDQNSSRDGFIETLTITKRQEVKYDY